MDELVHHCLRELSFDGDLGCNVSRLREFIVGFYTSQYDHTQLVDDAFCAFVWSIVVQQPSVRVGTLPPGSISEVYIAPQTSAKRKAAAKGEELIAGVPPSLELVEDARHKHLQDLKREYGDNLRIAVDPGTSFAAITGSHIKPPKLSPMVYSALQLITRGREDGITTVELGRKTNYDQKTCFYLIKQLVELSLIIKARRGGVGNHICIHKYFVQRSPLWQQIQDEEARNGEAMVTGERADTDEEVTGQDRSSQILFDPIDSRHLSSLPLVKNRIIKLLKGSRTHIHQSNNLLMTIGFVHPTKTDRRFFQTRLRELIQQGVIERVLVPSSKMRDRTIKCIRLVTSDNQLSEGSVVVRQDVDEDEKVVGHNEVRANLTIHKQVSNSLEEAGPSGLTLNDICISLGNFDKRTIELLLTRASNSRPPAHLLDLGTLDLMETFGRERRHRYFTLAAYKCVMASEQLQDTITSVIDVDLSRVGDFAILDPKHFYTTTAKLHSYQDSFKDITSAKGKKRKRDEEGSNEEESEPPPKPKRGRPCKTPALTIVSTTPSHSLRPSKRSRTNGGGKSRSNINISSLRRENELFKVIENMGGIANMHSKDIYEAHTALLDTMSQAKEPTSAPVGTRLDKRTAESTLKNLENRGRIKMLRTSLIAPSGVSRPACLVYLPDTPQDKVNAFLCQVEEVQSIEAKSVLRKKAEEARTQREQEIRGAIKETQQGPPITPTASVKKKGKVKEETEASRRPRFHWTQEFDELARDASAIIRARCRASRLDLSAFDQVFPTVPRNSVRQRITHLRDNTSEDTYMKRLEDQWYTIWLQYRGTPHLPDEDPNSSSNFNLINHIEFLRKHVDKNALRVGFVECEAPSKLAISVQELHKFYEVGEDVVPAPAWDFMWGTTVEEGREKQFRSQAFTKEPDSMYEGTKNQKVQLAEAALKMVFGTPSELYDPDSATRLLHSAGDQCVSVARSNLLHQGVLSKLVRDPRQPKPGRMLKISDANLNCLGGPFPRGLFQDAISLEDIAVERVVDEMEWPLIPSEGDIVTLLQLVSEDQVDFTVDLSQSRAARQMIDWNSKRADDEDIETSIRLRFSRTFVVGPGGNQDQSPESPVEPDSNTLGQGIHGTTLDGKEAACTLKTEVGVINCSACIDTAFAIFTSSLSQSDRDLARRILDSAHRLRETGLNKAECLGLECGVGGHILWLVHRMTLTSPPILFWTYFNAPILVAANYCGAWTVAVSDGPLTLVTPRRWLDLRGCRLDDTWGAAQQAVVSVVFLHPGISQAELQWRLRMVYDRQEIIDLLSSLQEENVLECQTDACVETIQSLPGWLKTLDDEETVFWFIAKNHHWYQI
ncbi:hypothetical protein J3R82DRAFT_1283 [Butyriboletus roseoflavus]|nr:hypothetical protein J3R82DRAFT_1283 [Butyriboletus roseoflavus]